MVYFLIYKINNYFYNKLYYQVACNLTITSHRNNTYLYVTEVCSVFLYSFEILYETSILDFIRFNANIESKAQTVHVTLIIAIQVFFNGFV